MTLAAHQGCPVLPRKTISSCCFADPGSWSSYKLLGSSAFRDAPGGTWDPIPGHSSRAEHPHLRPQHAGRNSSPSAVTGARDQSQPASPCPVALPLGLGPRGGESAETPFPKAALTRTRTSPGRGAWVGAARCPGGAPDPSSPSGAK